MILYRLADILFVVFHTSLILFNLLGWIRKKTRPANLVTILVTFTSWFLIGLIVGQIGYCPSTDWHFSILRELGHTDLPTSYIKYLADRVSGQDFSQKLVDDLTLWGLLTAFIISAALNIRDFIRKRKKT